MSEQRVKELREEFREGAALVFALEIPSAYLRDYNQFLESKALQLNAKWEQEIDLRIADLKNHTSMLKESGAEIKQLRQEVERLKNPWIQITNELPEHDDDVQVQFAGIMGLTETTANFEDGIWYDYQGRDMKEMGYKIIAWKELSPKQQ